MKVEKKVEVGDVLYKVGIGEEGQIYGEIVKFPLSGIGTQEWEGWSIYEEMPYELALKYVGSYGWGLREKTEWSVPFPKAYTEEAKKLRQMIEKTEDERHIKTLFERVRELVEEIREEHERQEAERLSELAKLRKRVKELEEENRRLKKLNRLLQKGD